MAMAKEIGKKGARGTGYRYTTEFRREALRMIDGGKTMAAVCEEFGATQGTLNYWKLKAAAGAGRETATGVGAEIVSAENDRLKREVKGIHAPNHVVCVKWRHRKPLGGAHWAAPDL